MTTSVNYDDVVVDTKALIFDATDSQPTSERCICRIPFDIRKLSEDAYTPKLISIGPFHHNLPRLQNMESHKLSYCKAFFLRSAPKHEKTYDQTFDYIRDVLPRFRCHYSGTIEPSDDKKLVDLILIDACFIIELFMKFFSFYNDDVVPPGEDGTLISIPRLSTIIRLDLILLENQLPFFLLDHIYNTFLGSGSSDLPSFIELTYEYFHFFRIPKLLDSDFNNNNKIRHFTDLIRTFHLQHPRKRTARKVDEVIQLPSVTELVRSGMKLVVNEHSECLLDVRLISRGVLEIPRLKVNGLTEGLLRNMMALEQFLYPEETYITDSVALFHFLLKTKEDVDLLVQKGVLINWLADSDSVANLFSSVWINNIQSNFDDKYNELLKDLNAYYEDPCNKTIAILKRDYCSTPWKIIGVITAASVFVFGGVQALSSVFELNKSY